MAFPAIAAQTFAKFKSDLFFRKIYKNSIRKLKSLKGDIKKAQYAHEKIDRKIDLLFQDQTIQKLVQCKKGCSACCHSQVSVSKEEVSVLVNKIRDGLKIDWTRLYIQSRAEDSSEKFFKLEFSSRACVFLGEKGECRVYEDRPSVCRTNYVVSDPQNCKTTAGGKNSVSLLKTYEADMVTYALFEQTKEAGAMAFMLWKALEKLGETKPSLAAPKKPFFHLEKRD